MTERQQAREQARELFNSKLAEGRAYGDNHGYGHPEVIRIRREAQQIVRDYVKNQT
jgi:hypothetical protein